MLSQTRLTLNTHNLTSPVAQETNPLSSLQWKHTIRTSGDVTNASVAVGGKHDSTISTQLKNFSSCGNYNWQESVRDVIRNVSHKFQATAIKLLCLYVSGSVLRA